MKTQIHTTPDAFDTLAEEWLTVLPPGSSTNIFLHPEWLRLWWQHKATPSCEIAIVTVRDDNDNLLGIGPWYIEQTSGERVVRFLGCTDIVDYLDIIARPGIEQQVLTGLLLFMMGDDAPEWTRFELCNIPGASGTLQDVETVAAATGLTLTPKSEEVCPVISLPDDYEEYLAELDKKQRHELRRKRRRAEGADVSWYIVGEEHDLDEEIEAFLELMAASTIEKADFLQEPGHRQFFIDTGHLMYHLGYLDLIVLTIEGQRAAAMWQFGYRDRMLLYNSGLDPESFSHLSPGIVLLTYSIEDAISRGFKHYDFLRGDEQYKFRMGSQPTEIFTLNINRAL